MPLQRNFELSPINRSSSAADLRQFDPLSPLEAAFRQNVCNPARGTARRNTDEFPVPVTAALIGRLPAFPEKD
jgi:hypothetical protein